MLLVFLILIIVTVCVTIVGTYFLLNAENYHWQWTSFFSAASTAVYVYLYSIYYYYVKTKMSGFFQTSFYFGYTLMFCLGLGILCGKFFRMSSNVVSPFFFFFKVFLNSSPPNSWWRIAFEAGSNGYNPSICLHPSIYNHRNLCTTGVKLINLILVLFL